MHAPCSADLVVHGSSITIRSVNGSGSGQAGCDAKVPCMPDTVKINNWKKLALPETVKADLQ